MRRSRAQGVVRGKPNAIDSFARGGQLRSSRGSTKDSSAEVRASGGHVGALFTGVGSISVTVVVVCVDKSVTIVVCAVVTTAGFFLRIDPAVVVVVYAIAA
jgi:hypothetical protein